jgi:hypothetical protein
MFTINEVLTSVICFSISLFPVRSRQIHREEQAVGLRERSVWGAKYRFVPSITVLRLKLVLLPLHVLSPAGRIRKWLRGWDCVLPKGGRRGSR